MRYRKRAHPRHERVGLVFLFSENQCVGRAEMIQESEGGARLRTNGQNLSQVRYILEPASAQVATVRLVWIDRQVAGFEYLSRGSVRDFTSDPGLAHVRDTWKAMAFEFSKVAPGGAFSR